MDKNLDDIFEERVIKKLGLTGLQYTAPKDVELIPAFTGRNGYLETVKKGDLPILGQHVPNYDSTKSFFLVESECLAQPRLHRLLEKIIRSRQSF